MNTHIYGGKGERGQLDSRKCSSKKRIFVQIVRQNATRPLIVHLTFWLQKRILLPVKTINLVEKWQRAQNPTAVVSASYTGSVIMEAFRTVTLLTNKMNYRDCYAKQR